MQLDARDLWGSEAAEDENPAVLDSYFTYQPSFKEFFDPSVRLLFARGRKGMGKSAILRQIAYLKQDDPNTIVLTLTGADLAAQRPIVAATGHAHLYDWQQRICAAINHQIGAQIGLALTDDQMLLVESAELAGLRSRNLVSALIDRLGRKLGPVTLEKHSATDHKQLLKRTDVNSERTVWVLVDDIDATFLASADETLRISTFFSACRELVNSFTGVNIRTTVRTDVWRVLRRFDESLDKCEQYMIDLEWGRRPMASLLSERIRAYLKRHGEEERLQEAERVVIGGSSIRMEDAIALGVAFEPFFQFFDEQKLPPQRTVHMFSGGRPRWAAQLCRAAGHEAAKNNAPRIAASHMAQVLPRFSKARIEDLLVEHKHQCPQLPQVIQNFAGTPPLMTLDDLIQRLEKMLASMEVHIDGTQTSQPLHLGRFLFRIGFFSGRQQNPKTPKQFTYYRFDDMPSLLLDGSGFDQNLVWCITPAYRHALKTPGW